ncbi:MAG: hypothetical protein ABTA16_05105 [Niallia sp.]
MEIKEISLIDIMDSQINTGYFDKEVMRYHSGDRRRAYRLVMACYFTSSFLDNEREFNWAQHQAFRFFTSWKLNDYTMIDDKVLNEVLARSVSYLCNSCYFKFLKQNDENGNIINDTLLNKYIEFLTNYLKSEKKLFLYNDLEEFWDIEKLYNNTINIKMHPHHWIELYRFRYKTPIHTFPEFFAYQDVINLWNETLSKYKELEILADKYNINDKAVRTVNYSYSSLLRNTLTAGVHYFETYLYYIYYNLKSKMKFSHNKVIKRSDVRKINDKEIINELLYKEIANLESLTSKNWSEYIKTLEYRDAFVHMSAFEEKGISRMEYLVSFDQEKLITFLENIFEFIEHIENSLGQDKILFWKEMFEEPNFDENLPVSNLKN